MTVLPHCIRHTKSLLDDGVVGDGNALATDLGIASLVDELADGLLAGVTPRDVRVRDTQHLDGGLVQLHEHAVVDLAQAEQLQDLARARVDLVDAPNADDKCELRLVRHIVVSTLASVALQGELLSLVLAVLVQVLLGALEDLDLLRLSDLNQQLSGMEKYSVYEEQSLVHIRTVR